MYPDTGYSETNFKGTTVVTDDMRCDMNCVRLDPAGNMYVGGFVQNADGLKPPGFDNDAFFRQCGSEVKFSAGTHAFTWHGDDAQGKPVSAGLYVYRLTAGNRVMTLKTIMAK